MKKSKLSIEKFRILELTSISNIHGGTGGNGGVTEIPTLTNDSAATTFTTDPDVYCPSGDTGDTNNSNNTIPTLSKSNNGYDTTSTVSV
jgi:hypothetical protein